MAVTNLRDHEEPPVDLNMNDGDAMRIQSLEPVRHIFLGLDSDTDLQADILPPPIRQWPLSGASQYEEGIFSAKPERDGYEPGMPSRRWGSPRPDYAVDLAGENTIHALGSSHASLWPKGGVQDWTEFEAARSHLRMPPDRSGKTASWNDGLPVWYSDFAAEGTEQGEVLDPADLAVADLKLNVTSRVD